MGWIHMTHSNHIARAWKYLSHSEQSQIAILKTTNYSNRQIARALGRGNKPLIVKYIAELSLNLIVKSNSAKFMITIRSATISDAGQAAYDKLRLNCDRWPKWADTDAFIKWADDKLLLEK